MNKYENELTKVKNENTATCETLRRVRIEISDTKQNLITMSTDLSSARQQFQEQKLRNLALLSETEYKLKDTKVELFKKVFIFSPAFL